MRPNVHVETVRRDLTEERSSQVLSFWSAHGVLAGDAARQRLTEIVCLLLRDDDVIGVNSVYEADVPLIGGRRFWLYRRFVAPDVVADGHDTPMLNAAFDALEAEHVVGTGPVGVCVLVDDQELLRARPEAVWPETQLLYAGYLPGGQQVRIRYFEDAVIV